MTFKLRPKMLLELLLRLVRRDPSRLVFAEQLGCGATDWVDLHLLQISRLQAHLITKAIENMRATILAILLAAGAMILGLAIGLIISGDISDIWSNWRALVH
jgi:hypothetical protein